MSLWKLSEDIYMNVIEKMVDRMLRRIAWKSRYTKIEVQKETRRKEFLEKINQKQKTPLEMAAKDWKKVKENLEELDSSHSIEKSDYLLMKSEKAKNKESDNSR